MTPGLILLTYGFACYPHQPWFMLVVTMFQFTLNRRVVRTVALLLLPALLFAQGLRLCFHSPVHAAHIDAHAHASAVHLESTLSLAGDHEESAGDVDVAFAALLKIFYSLLAFAVVSAFVVIATAPRVHKRRIAPVQFYFHPYAVYSLTPPLRAPPR